MSCILGVTGTLELVVPSNARLGHPAWRKSLLRAGLKEDFVNEIVADVSKQFPAWQEASFPGLLGNVVAGRIANRLDLGGTNSVVDAACASSFRYPYCCYGIANWSSRYGYYRWYGYLQRYFYVYVF